MSKSNEHLIQKVKNALNELFSNTGVSLDQTLADLQEIEIEVQNFIECVESDLENQRDIE